MIDNNFTIKMKRWLDEPEHTDNQDILDGAMMLLQLNRNQSMFNTIIRRPEKYVDKIVYELKKFLPMRLAQLTIADVKILDAEITPAIREAIASVPDDATGDDSQPARVGKRADHDALPDNIKNIWEYNALRWKKIKEAYNSCLNLTEPCDRYEYLSIMKELWYKYKSEFVRYDEYTVSTKPESVETDPVEIAKAISNARSYISKNADTLVSLKADAFNDGADAASMEKYNSLLKNMSDRVQILFDNKQVIGGDLKKKLQDGGIEFSTSVNQNNGEGETNSETSEAAE